jgi:glutathione peroxidase
MSFYDIEVKTIDEEIISLKAYEGKVLLIVNTASKCGFTPQYKELEALYQKLSNEKFEILGFPCNQFGEQEPGASEEIKSFCELNYGVTFPLFEKIDVKGPSAHPLFKYLCEQQKGILGGSIKWNFTKFLVDSKGNVVDRFAPATSPLKLEQKIVEFINKI